MVTPKACTDKKEIAFVSKNMCNTNTILGINYEKNKEKIKPANLQMNTKY